MKRIAMLLVGLALMFAVPSSAFAQGTTSECQTYGPETCGITASQSTGEASDATLPFTGMNTTLLVVVGAGLLGTGFVVRRLTRATR